MQQKKKLLKKMCMMNQLKKVNVIDINELVEKTDYNAKVNEIKSEISSIAGLVTTAVLNPTLAIQSKKQVMMQK